MTQRVAFWAMFWIWAATFGALMLCAVACYQPRVERCELHDCPRSATDVYLVRGSPLYAAECVCIANGSVQRGDDVNVFVIATTPARIR